MDQNTVTLLAGTLSTVIFAASNIPMLVKVIHLRDLRSYSATNLLLTNLGNLVHWVYIVSLPLGPIWLLHGFYTVTALVMLALYLRYRPRPARNITLRGRNAAIFQTQELCSA